ncbi:MAG TPA: hypothetical protein VGG19_15040 [Tepidisphaeraceae bacterium]
MIRHMRDLLSLICLPLLVLVLVMWARSYFVLDRLTFRSVDNQDCHLRSDLGHVTWFWTTPLHPHKHVLPVLTTAVLPSCDELIKVWESLGFHHEFERVPSHGVEPAMARSLTMVPYWFLFLLTATAPGWRAQAKWWKSRQVRIDAALPDKSL